MVLLCIFDVNTFGIYVVSSALLLNLLFSLKCILILIWSNLLEGNTHAQEINVSQCPV
jgi:hypothetical protein